MKRYVRCVVSDANNKENPLRITLKVKNSADFDKADKLIEQLSTLLSGFEYFINESDGTFVVVVEDVT